ncbi:DEAD/DEAH box helicase [Nanoarchaeota archaeon]
MKFEELGIIKPILSAIEELGFTEPTEIQAKTIPHIVEGKDVIAGSATGSGKTLAFGAGIIQNCEKGRGIQALVLTPTRELAEQIYKHMKTFSKHKKLNITVIYGGVSINPQFHNLEKADVVIGTPGRILDHMQRRTIDLSNVKTLVLDEADRMLDMGFIDDVQRIISQCPKQRQTLLFSATIRQEIIDLSRRYMNQPKKISAEVYVDPSKLKQVYYDVRDNMKFSLLLHLLKKEHEGLIMVFCNTRKNTDFVANNLSRNGINALSIHGGHTQNKRSKVMDTFHDTDKFVLVCTDVAARGLDIKGVNHIYNYDICKESKEYIHRIGRTARAGESGKVINVLGPRDHDNFSRVLRDNDVNIKKMGTPQMEKVPFKSDAGRFSDGSSDRGRFGGPRRGHGGSRGHSGPRSRYGGSRGQGGRGGSRSNSDGPRRSYGGSRPGGRSHSGPRSGSRSGSGGHGRSQGGSRGKSSSGRFGRKSESKSYGQSY